MSVTHSHYSEYSKYTNRNMECENTHKLFDQTIHNELLEWSISEPSASATLAE